MSVRIWAIGAVAVLLAGAGGPARAGLFRCQQPDGTTIFTDNAAACPGARPHQPRDVIQSVPTAPPTERSLQPSAAMRAAQRELALEAEAAQENVWRQTKARKEAELQHVEQRRERLREYVSWCNRGGALSRRGDDGIKRSISCDSVRGEYASLEAQAQTLREYLADGIFEDCRRAGCLPGWVR